MQVSKGTLALSCGLSIFVFSTGCDQITALTTKFTKKETSPQKDSQSPQAPNTSKAPDASENRPLGPNDLARVGSWVLTQAEFKERMENLKTMIPEFDSADLGSKALVLEELIRQQLLVSDARQRGLDKDKDIRAAVEDFERTLLVQQVAADLTEGITVTEEEARAFYQENINELEEAPEYHVQEIVSYTQTGANDIRAEIESGADFAKVAKERSKAESSTKGGDLGFVSQFPFERMEEEVKALTAGQLSNVFEGPDGYYVVKLVEKRGGEVKPFEEYREDIIQGLTIRKQQEAVMAHLEKLAEQTTIEVNEELLEK